jgi:hypothetical protein
MLRTYCKVFHHPQEHTLNKWIAEEEEGAISIGQNFNITKVAQSESMSVDEDGMSHSITLTIFYTLETL